MQYQTKSGLTRRRAHGSDDIGIGRIYHPPHTGCICSSIRTPVAGKCDNAFSWIIFKHGIDLSVDRLVRKMPHGNGIKFTLRRTSTTTRAGSRDHLGWLAFLPGDRAERTNINADPT